MTVTVSGSETLFGEGSFTKAIALREMEIMCV